MYSELNVLIFVFDIIIAAIEFLHAIFVGSIKHAWSLFYLILNVNSMTVVLLYVNA